MVLASTRVLWASNQRGVAADAARSGTTARPSGHDTHVGWHRSDRVSLTDKDTIRRRTRYQGVSDADECWHVQFLAVSAVYVRANAILHSSDQRNGARAASAPLQPNGKRRRLRG